MALLMPDIHLRRKRRTFENFWLRALRGDNNDATNSEHIQVQSTANVSSWRSSRTLQGDEEEANAKPELETPAKGNQESHVAAPPTSQKSVAAKPKPRYVKRVQGPTLGYVLDRIRQNEGGVSELDFSNLSSRNKRLEPYGGVLVARVLTMNSTVTRLVIRDHAIGDRGAVAIANMLRFNKTLEYIDLYSNDISDAGAEALAKALYGHETVQHLALWSNAITNRGARAFADALKCNRSLKYLGLVHNRITEEGGQALLDALDVNTHLETLNLATNRVPYAITAKIRVSLARNRVEAPRVRTTMKTAEEEVKKRLEELMRRAESGDDDDTSSEASGFLSCSDTEEEDAGGVWI